MLKYLRIAVTALCLTACVLLVALWVRSYWWVDAVYIAQTYSAASMRGQLYFQPTTRYSGARRQSSDHQLGAVYTISFRIGGQDDDVRIDGRADFPVWMLTLFVTALTAVPWFPWSKRFSLRTLLIATTLVAVVLGLVMWVSR
jgi:hypothetical protein